MLQLAPDTWESIICSAWDAVRDRVETKRDLEFAHEHTLQFHFGGSKSTDPVGEWSKFSHDTWKDGLL